MNLKRKHHFVSQFYLRKWYNNKGKIIVWDGDKNFPSKSESIAFEKNLYKLIELTPKQEKFFHDLISSLELENTSTYQLFAKVIFETREFMRKRFETLDTLGIKVSEELNNIEKEFHHNVIEDKFSYQEERFSTLLGKINVEPNLELSLMDYDTLIHFIMFQYFRTPKKINEAIFNMKDSNIMEKFDFSKEQYQFFMMLLAQCFLERIHLSCLSQLYKINIYKNTSKINFITSDDPCFNQSFDKNEFYIQLPISPNIMIELAENDCNKKYKESMKEYFNFNKEYSENIILDKKLIGFDFISENKVIELNQKIFDKRDRFIYAQTQSDIASLST
jgi:hypothetical protein